MHSPAQVGQATAQHDKARTCKCTECCLPALPRHTAYHIQTCLPHSPWLRVPVQVGSISDNRLGGWYSYRASKAALNQLTRTMALELARKKLPVAAVLLHPGTCETGLSQPFQKVCRRWGG